MMSGQTKLSVDTAKEVQADATLKTKVRGLYQYFSFSVGYLSTFFN